MRSELQHALDVDLSRRDVLEEVPAALCRVAKVGLEARTGGERRERGVFDGVRCRQLDDIAHMGAPVVADEGAEDQSTIELLAIERCSDSRVEYDRGRAEVLLLSLRFFKARSRGETNLPSVAEAGPESPAGASEETMGLPVREGVREWRWWAIQLTTPAS